MSCIIRFSFAFFADKPMVFMNRLNLVSVISILIFFSSCSMEKRLYRNGYNFDLKSVNAEKQRRGKPLVIKATDISIEDGLLASVNDENLLALSEKHSVKIEGISESIAEECDLIIFLNGEEISVKVIGTGSDEIRYKRCSNLSGPTYSIRKSEIFMVKYADGTKEVFSIPSEPNKPGAPAYGKRRTEGFSLAGFITSIAGLLFFALPFGLASLVFGILGLGKIQNKPDKLKGKGFAIVAIILGLLEIVIGIVIISANGL